MEDELAYDTLLAGDEDGDEEKDDYQSDEEAGDDKHSDGVCLFVFVSCGNVVESATHR